MSDQMSLEQNAKYKKDVLYMWKKTNKDGTLGFDEINFESKRWIEKLRRLTV